MFKEEIIYSGKKLTVEPLIFVAVWYCLWYIDTMFPYFRSSRCDN